jgi:hypothetical protein
VSLLAVVTSPLLGWVLVSLVVAFDLTALIGEQPEVDASCALAERLLAGYASAVTASVG